MNKETAADYFAYRKTYRFEEAFSAIKGEKGSIEDTARDRQGAGPSTSWIWPKPILSCFSETSATGRPNYLAIRFGIASPPEGRR
jgi:hypothetical protein